MCLRQHGTICSLGLFGVRIRLVGLSLLVSNAASLVCPNKRLSRSPEMRKEGRSRAVDEEPSMTLRGVASF